MANNRDSQFELLRIVAMFFVVTHHLVIKGADTVGYVTPYEIDTHGYIGVLINSFVVGGVNLFVLITGWYGVKNIYKGVVRILVDCFVFGVFSYLLLIILTDKSFVLKELVKSGFFTKNWFVVAYIMLLLIAPIIEMSLKYVNYNQFRLWIFLLTVFNLYFGYYLGHLNTNGYNVVQFVWLYYIARFLKMSDECQWQERLSHYGFYVYMFSSILLASIFIGASCLSHTLNSIRWFSYNNPIFMISAIGLFMRISKMSIKSKFVNLIATGVFGIFLLHTTPYVQPYRNSITNEIYSSYGYIGILFEVLFLFMILCIISIGINKMNLPIIALICKKSNIKILVD